MSHATPTTTELDALEYVYSCQFSAPASILGTFGCFLALASIFHKVLSSYSPLYVKIDGLKKRKVIMYFTSILFRAFCLTLAVFIASFSSSNGLILDRSNCFQVQALQLLVVVYSQAALFELCRIPELTWDFWIHHLTIIGVSLSLLDPESSVSRSRGDPWYTQVMIWVGVGGSSMFLYQPAMIVYHLSESLVNKKKALEFRLVIHSAISLLCFCLLPYGSIILGWAHMDFQGRFLALLFTSANCIVETYVLRVLFVIWRHKKEQLADHCKYESNRYNSLSIQVGNGYIHPAFLFPEHITPSHTSTPTTAFSFQTETYDDHMYSVGGFGQVQVALLKPKYTVNKRLKRIVLANVTSRSSTFSDSSWDARDYRLIQN